jgi:hypothetical protein
MRSAFPNATVTGRDSADPVSTEYTSGFTFTAGTIHNVVYDTYIDLQRRLDAILARD